MGAIGDVVQVLEKIPVWRALKTLPDRVEALEAKVKELEAVIAGGVGDRCPSCGRPTYLVVSSKPDPVMGVVGAKRQTKRCKACGFQDTDMVTAKT